MAENDVLFLFGDFNRPFISYVPDEDNPQIFYPTNMTKEVDEKL